MLLHLEDTEKIANLTTEVKKFRVLFVITGSYFSLFTVEWVNFGYDFLTG